MKTTTRRPRKKGSSLKTQKKIPAFFHKLETTAAEISTKNPPKSHSYSYLPNTTSIVKHVRPETPKNPRPKHEHRFTSTHKQQHKYKSDFKPILDQPQNKNLFFYKKNPPNPNTKSLEPPQQTYCCQQTKSKPNQKLKSKHTNHRETYAIDPNQMNTYHRETHIMPPHHHNKTSAAMNPIPINPL